MLALITIIIPNGGVPLREFHDNVSSNCHTSSETGGCQEFQIHFCMGGFLLGNFRFIVFRIT